MSCNVTMLHFSFGFSSLYLRPSLLVFFLEYHSFVQIVLVLVLVLSVLRAHK